MVETAIKEKGSKEKALMDDKVYKAKEEIRDLEELLPEIQAKYEDAREMELEHSEASQAVKEASENLHRSPAKNPPAKAGCSSSSLAGSSSSFSSTASTSSSLASKLNGAGSSAFTAPFPREEEKEEAGVAKITFGSRSSSVPSGATTIGVRRNLNKESEASSSSSSSSAFASSSSAIPSGAVNDISCLVRRKRKPDAPGASAATPAPVANGSGAAATATNGDASHSTAAASSTTNGVSDGVSSGVDNHVNGFEDMPDAKRVKTNGDA